MLFRSIIDASGNVGIGTTTISAGLQVTKNSFYFETESGTPMILGYNGRVGIGTSNIPTGLLSIENTGSDASFYVEDQSGDTTPFVIDASGNVGIGTASPSYALDVAGQVNITASAFPISIIRTTGGGAGDALWATQKLVLNQADNLPSGPGTYMMSNNSAGTSTYLGIFGGSLTTNTAGSEIGQMVFSAAYHGADPGSNQHLLIRATGTTTGDVLVPNGKLGVGDNTPDHMLDVAGNIGLNASSYINFGDTDGSTGYGFRDNAGTIEYKNSGGSWATFGGSSTTLQGAYGADADGGDTTISLTSADDSLIFTNPSSAGTDSAFLLRLSQANTTAAVVALDIVQSSKIGRAHV